MVTAMRRPTARLWLAGLVALVLALGPPRRAVLPRHATTAMPEPYFALVVDPRRPRLYASDLNGDAVDVLATTGEVIASVRVGRQPAGLAISPDGHELAVATYAAGQLVFVDLDTLAITKRIV